MSYVAWSVVAFEVPTAAKWNILGANDASFNDGTGIADGKILTRHILNANVTMPKIVNPYKARAYLTANQTVADNTTAKITLNAESYDSNNNFDPTTNYRYVAPVTGYYSVSAQVSITDAESKISSSYGRLTKNGTAIIQNYQLPCFGSNTANGITHAISDVIFLTAGDYLELTTWADTIDNGSVVVVGGPTFTYLSAHLLSV